MHFSNMVWQTTFCVIRKNVFIILLTEKKKTIFNKTVSDKKITCWQIMKNYRVKKERDSLNEKFFIVYLNFKVFKPVSKRIRKKDF